MQVKYQQKYEQEIKGKASTEAGAAEFTLAKENAEKFSQVTNLIPFTFKCILNYCSVKSHEINGIFQISTYPQANTHYFLSANHLNFR